MGLFNQIARRCFGQRNGYINFQVAQNCGLGGTSLRSFKVLTITMKSFIKCSGEAHPSYIKIRKEMEKSQVHDGFPTTHFKCGCWSYYCLYGFALGLASPGFEKFYWYCYYKIFPPKSDDEDEKRKRRRE